MIIADTPEAIRYYRYRAMLSALKIEVKTKLRHSRGSVLMAANKEFGTNLTRKTQMIEHLEKVIDKMERGR